jgi:hypothetical protein
MVSDEAVINTTRVLIPAGNVARRVNAQIRDVIRRSVAGHEIGIETRKVPVRVAEEEVGREYIRYRVVRGIKTYDFASRVNSLRNSSEYGKRGGRGRGGKVELGKVPAAG